MNNIRIVTREEREVRKITKESYQEKGNRKMEEKTLALALREQSSIFLLSLKPRHSLANSWLSKEKIR